jgi:hypothetical protein
MNVRKATSSITRPANTTTYAAGEVVSNADGDRHTFTGLPAFTGQGYLIEAGLVVHSVVQTTPPDLELWLFSADVAAVADNAAFAPTDAEILTLIGIITFATASFKKGTVNMACVQNNLGISAVGDTLYGVLVVRNAYVPPSNSEVVTVVLTAIR